VPLAEPDAGLLDGHQKELLAGESGKKIKKQQNIITTTK